jgi:hypothetical protein
MEPVDQKLADWKAIYDQLQAARARRTAAFNGRQGSARQLDELDAEMARLQTANDEALQALYKAVGPPRK